MKQSIMTRHTTALLLIGATATQVIGDLAKVEALVVDAEDGHPIPNIVVMASFGNDNGWKAWTEAAPINHDAQTTDVHGRCRLSGRTSTGDVGCWVNAGQKDYYGTGSGIGFKLEKKDLLGVWQPDNLVATITLQRIEHPIPLFIKRFENGGADYVNSDLFAKGEGCLQLDLMKGEWLPPVGNGERADVVFTRLPHEDLGIGTNFNGRTAISYRDSMAVVFAGKGNGLEEVPCPDMAGLMIREAHMDGYRQEYLCWKGRMSDLKYSSHFDRRRNFVFRIRTQYDENGKIKSAYYGKIYGDIDFKKLIGSAVAVAAPSFCYYLNPSENDTNLEWDMKNNLCPIPGDIGELRP